MNLQPPEKQVRLNSGYLEVHSIFSTIQGEGPFTGYRAIFVRLAGCNLQCPGCDTDYTSTRSIYAPNELTAAVAKLAGDQLDYLVVITGGEPFRQNLQPAVRALLDRGFEVQIETNGSLFQMLEYSRITIVCSPKTATVHPKLVPEIAAYKYVIQAGKVAEDGLPTEALGHRAEPQVARPPFYHSGVYVQPMDEQSPDKNLTNLKATIASVIQHGHILGIQTHKLIGVE